MKTIDAEICAIFHKAFLERMQYAADGKCPTTLSSNVALAPSSVAGKAGGLDFFTSSARYVEGSYRMTLSVSLIRKELAPEYLSEFAGEPRSRPGSEP